MKNVLLAALFVLLFTFTVRADSGDVTVVFSEIVLPVNNSYPQGFFVTEGQCLDVMMGTDNLTFYSTIAVTLPVSVAYSGQFGWMPVDWSIENFAADWTLFLDQWNNLPGVVISDVSVRESPCPPSVPESSEWMMLFTGILGLVALKWGQRATEREKILVSNMEVNGWKRVITNDNSWRWTQPLEKSDVVLDWP